MCIAVETPLDVFRKAAWCGISDSGRQANGQDGMIFFFRGKSNRKNRESKRGIFLLYNMDCMHERPEFGG